MNVTRILDRNQAMIIPLLLSCVIFGFVLKNASQVKTYVVDSYAEVGDVLGSCQQGCVAFFDIDDTLIEPKNELLQSPTLNHPIITRYLALFFKKHSPAFHDQLISRVMYQAEYKLTEPSVKDMITQLKDQGANVLGLTAMVVGPYGDIPDMAKWRVKQLSKLHLSFFAKPYTQHSLYIGPIQKSLQPGYKQGILMSLHWPKGRVMESFFMTQHLPLPKKIVFVDDLQTNIESMSNTCKKLGIACQLIRYRHAKIPEHPVQPMLAKKQYQQIIQQQIEYGNE